MDDSDRNDDKISYRDNDEHDDDDDDNDSRTEKRARMYERRSAAMRHAGMEAWMHGSMIGGKSASSEHHYLDSHYLF